MSEELETAGDPGGRPRQTQLVRRRRGSILAIVGVVVVSVGLVGCFPIAPTRPMPSGYVVSDGQDLWLQVVCGSGFSLVEVVQESADGQFLWTATAGVSGPQPRLKLLASDIPGYTTAREGVLEPTEPAIVRYEGSDISEGGLELTMSDTVKGDVAYYRGVVSGEEFSRIPRESFGC